MKNHTSYTDFENARSLAHQQDFLGVSGREVQQGMVGL
jgi:hypothetical protein